MTNWKPLIEQGSRIDDTTASAFMARIAVADRQTVARKCVWAPVGRALWQLHKTAIMQQSNMTATRQTIEQLLQENVDEMSEGEAKSLFSAVVDCARSTRDKLWHAWMSSE